MLGISYKALLYKMRQFNLDTPRTRKSGFYNSSRRAGLGWWGRGATKRLPAIPVTDSGNAGRKPVYLRHGGEDGGMTETPYDSTV